MGGEGGRPPVSVRRQGNDQGRGRKSNFDTDGELLEIILCAKVVTHNGFSVSLHLLVPSFPLLLDLEKHSRP